MSDKKQNEYVRDHRRREEEKKKEMEKERVELERKKREVSNKMAGHASAAGFLTRACNAHKERNTEIGSNQNFKQMEENLSNPIWKKYRWYKRSDRQFVIWIILKSRGRTKIYTTTTILLLKSYRYLDIKDCKIHIGDALKILF